MSSPEPDERRRGDEAAREIVDSIGRILSNYQAALHLLEEAVAGDETFPRRVESLHGATQAVLEPVRQACADVAAGVDDLVEASENGGGDPRDVVSAERQRVAAAHSRLIRRAPALVAAAERRDPASLAAVAGRLAELAAGSHSAGALFRSLLARWQP